MQNGSVCNVNGNVFGIEGINNRGGNKIGNDIGAVIDHY